tara:strand:+ start:262 stop:408 length:147 start_codon:yes stop_codon:yes gene_type:complete
MGEKHGAGKGDRYRKVDLKKYAENWDKAFPKKKTPKKKITKTKGDNNV